MQTSGCSAVCCAVGARHGLVYLAQYAMLRECDTGSGCSPVHCYRHEVWLGITLHCAEGRLMGGCNAVCNVVGIRYDLAVILQQTIQWL